ncbi:FAD binding domain-containing protein [Mycolicibacterium arseniciresistens]|uniref:FAD-dependent monooxygenase n=1 Tax=Mycolicibacterium arseniciresistens TaxID=3062257 RepID=A0ABT8UCN7_9MYCO|nr:FAD-dependent monooxygenase [Mycolicibacterium arseniciresistens]MDO3635556.1 FAD-dependent monooxygenase [Mycolicibacterium arseniciresistens]
MPNAFRAVVVGGSLGGLAAAHELAAVGADVAVYERSVDRTQPRGAGIVMQPEVESLLRRLGRTVPSVSVELHERQQLHRRGDPSRYRAPQWMTAWDTLHDALRSPLESVCVRLDSTLESLHRHDGKVTAAFTDGYVTGGDLVVGADGIGSATRRSLTGRDDLRYAGYVALRGLEEESALPDELRSLLAERFTMFAVPGLQMLCYLVPGARGETAPGQRRVNWVWYVNTAESRLPDLLTGRSGRRFDQFLPPGELSAESEGSVLTLADGALPAPFAALVRHSSVFLQPVFDLMPARMVADHVVLLGDAVGTVRPHTASGTSKALGDAAGLARALAGWNAGDPLPLPALQAWEAGRLAHLRAVAAAGVRLAEGSSLGAGTGPLL